MDLAGLREDLPIDRRLALAYAPSALKSSYLAFLALDARLERVVTAAREPMLAQVRLAWWRERLTDLHEVPKGEPLLGLLATAGLPAASLIALADGWEAALIEPAAGGVAQLARARAELFRTLGGDAGFGPGQDWALADLAGLPGPIGLAANAAAGDDRLSHHRLPRALRPLAVLRALAARKGDRHGPGFALTTLLIALRVGMLGI